MGTVSTFPPHAQAPRSSNGAQLISDSGRGNFAALAAVTLATGLAFAGWTTLGPLGPGLQQQLSINDTRLALLVAVPVLVGSLLRVPVGVLADRIGGRRTLAILLAITPIPLLLMGLYNDSYVALLIAAVLLGVSGSSFAAGVRFIETQYPKPRQGFALGVYGVAVAGSVATALVAPRLAHSFGVSIPFFVLAVAAVMAFAVFTVCTSESETTAATCDTQTPLRAVLRSPATFSPALFYAVAFGGFVACFAYLPKLLVSTAGMSTTMAATWAAAFAAVTVAARVAGGSIADRSGPRTVLLWTFALIVVASLGLALDYRNSVTLAAAFAALAIAFGSAAGATMKLLAQRFDAGLGRAAGVVGAAGGLGGFIPPLLLATMAGSAAGYAIPFLGLTAMAAVCFAIGSRLGPDPDRDEIVVPEAEPFAARRVSEVDVPARKFDDALDELPADFAARVRARIDATSEACTGRVVWHVNTTAQGGGVAEMLASLVAYERGAGIDARWVVIGGDTEFFAITKRIHNRLHGSLGDGGALDAAATAAYEATLLPNGEELKEMISPGDIVILHDPQTAGLAPLLRMTCAHLVWRCHIGLDDHNEVASDTWTFLRDYVDAADELIFSRPEHIWTGMNLERVRIVPPAIDQRSPKNQRMSADVVDAILAKVGIMQSPTTVDPDFTRQDGTTSRVACQAEMLACSSLDPELPIVCQVSRWDSLKDPVGVLRGFVDHVLPLHNAQLVLAGPSVAGVTDDPEQAEVLEGVMAVWRSLDDADRARIAVVCLPMDDVEENAAIVNALQRRSSVIVQKSLAEGFGLTVAEAMWKGTPVVASGVGGIQDQIDDSVNGSLIGTPGDLADFGARVSRLLQDHVEADRMGDAGRESVRELFLLARHMMQDAQLYEDMLDNEWAYEPLGSLA